MTPFFSIIVPIYNSEKFLNECINSILHQTYQNWELILVDDGSTDNSGTICDEYSANQNNIRVFHQKNKGQFLAREAGIKNAKGTHLIFVDSDDFLELDALDCLSKCLCEKKTDLILYDSYHYINGKKEKAKDNIDFCEVFEEHKQIVKQCFLKRTSRISMCAYCFDKSLFNEEMCLENTNNLCGSRSQEDFLMVYSLVEKAHSLRVIDKLLYNYRMNPNSTSHNINAKSFYDGLLISSTIYKDIMEKYGFSIRNDFDEYIKRRLSWLPLSYLLRCGNSCSPKELGSEFKRIKKDFLYRCFTKEYRFSKSYNLFILLLKFHLNILAKKIAVRVS